MKNRFYIIIGLLAVVLIFAVAACLQLGIAPDVPAMQTDPVLTQATNPPETSASPATDTPAGSTEETHIEQPEPTWMTFPAERELTAQQYFVYDCQAEDFTVLSGSADERIYPASITKLFTAYVALQFLNQSDEITAGDALELLIPGSSVAYIEKGDVLTVERLVEAMLLPSGNDAAYILAAAAGRKLDGDPSEGAWYAVERFMKEVNSQAQALGMTGTHFVNPDGIHSDDHYMTPKDLVQMAKLALQMPVVMTYAGTATDTVTLSDREPQEWKNTNALIHPESPYYCPYAVGLKTGQTPYAGSCLLSAFQVEGRTLIIGVFGCPETEDRFPDTLQLFNQALGVTEAGRG